MVQYDMSADSDGEVLRGSVTCLVPELPGGVKRVVPGPSMIRHQIPQTPFFLKTIWLLSAKKVKSSHLFECWTNFSEP